MLRKALVSTLYQWPPSISCDYIAKMRRMEQTFTNYIDKLWLLLNVVWHHFKSNWVHPQFVSCFSFLYSVLWIVVCLFILYHFAIVLSVLLVTASGYPHCIVCSSRYSFWLSPLYFKWVFFQQYFYCIVAVSFIDGL